MYKEHVLEALTKNEATNQIVIAYKLIVNNKRMTAQGRPLSQAEEEAYNDALFGAKARRATMPREPSAMQVVRNNLVVPKPGKLRPGGIFWLQADFRQKQGSGKLSKLGLPISTPSSPNSKIHLDTNSSKARRQRQADRSPLAVALG